MRPQRQQQPQPRTPRRTGAALAAGAVLGFAALVSLAGPASAVDDTSGSTIDKPTGAATVDGHDPLTVAATVHCALTVPGCSSSVTLHLLDPQPDTSACYDQVLGSGKQDGAHLTGSLDPSDAYPVGRADGCGGLIGAPAYNGTWTIVLSDSSSVADSRSVVVAVAPAAPQDLTVALDGSTATVSWRPGVEPDLLPYLVQVDGTPTGDPVQPAACSARCTASVPAVVGDTVTVVARRPKTYGGSEVLTTPSQGEVAGPVATADPGATSSSPTTVGAAAAPGTAGTATPSPASGTSGSRRRHAPVSKGKASTAPLGAAQARKAIKELGAAPGSAALGAQLPALVPGVAAAAGVPLPTLAPPGDGEPTVDGTYSPTLGYTSTRRVSSPVVTSAGGPIDDVAGAVGLSGHQLVTSLAGGLLLLLAAGHTRSWVRRQPHDDLV